VSFETLKSSTGHQCTQSTVTISQVVTDVELVSRSTLLESTLASGHYPEFCDRKISLCKDPTESTVWSFLKVCSAQWSPCHMFNLFIIIVVYNNKTQVRKITK